MCACVCVCVCVCWRVCVCVLFIYILSKIILSQISPLHSINADLFSRKLLRIFVKFGLRFRQSILYIRPVVHTSSNGPLTSLRTMLTLFFSLVALGIISVAIAMVVSVLLFSYQLSMPMTLIQFGLGSCS